MNDANGSSKTKPNLGYPWYPDRGDGSYWNPILHADYSDPDVLRHGDDYFMVTSSFTCTPGLPILHSVDLVNWRLVNYAIKNVPHPRYRDVQPGCGAWAPSMRHHDGKFWIFFPMPDEGIYWVTAEDPRGPWSEPYLLQEAKGWIDPCPFWDEDGTAWLFHAYANSRSGKRDKIHARPMAPDCTRLLGEGKIIIDTPQHPYLEGPKVHKMNGWYYVMAPGGGVPTGWQVAFRSREIYGPYEEKIVLERGSTEINGPHQGAFIDDAAGEWWFMHFQDAGPFGRIVHMQPVAWEEGWPVIGMDYDGNGIGEPVPCWRKPVTGLTAPRMTLEAGDEFDQGKLALPWQWQANHKEEWYSLTERPGWLRLYAEEFTGVDLISAPNLLMQKFPAREFTAETQVDVAGLTEKESAGLVVCGGGKQAGIRVCNGSEGLKLQFQTSGVASEEAVVQGGTMKLKVAVDAEARCTFSYKAEGSEAWRALGEGFQALHGGWLGAKVGIYCVKERVNGGKGAADFSWFRFSGPGAG